MFYAGSSGLQFLPHSALQMAPSGESLCGRKTKEETAAIRSASEDYNAKVNGLTETLSMVRGLENSPSRSDLILVILSRE